jgi:hypothetical protein
MAAGLYGTLIEEVANGQGLETGMLVSVVTGRLLRQSLLLSSSHILLLFFWLIYYPKCSGGSSNYVLPPFPMMKLFLL